MGHYSVPSGDRVFPGFLNGNVKLEGERNEDGAGVDLVLKLESFVERDHRW